jgi:hypothetical protein
MKKSSHWLGAVVFATVTGCSSWAVAQNQTATLNQVAPGNVFPFSVPFSVQIQTAFVMPSGLQSFVLGTYQGQWLLLSGRINGLHGFGNSNNFPPDTQNTAVVVVNPAKHTVTTRLLTDAESGLTQAQIDLLTVTGAQFFQSGTTLYMCGGYGFDTATNNFTTKAALTAIDVPGLIQWVTKPRPGNTAAENISSVSNPIFQESGGVMVEESPGHALLVFGEDFEGAITVSSTGTYSGQVRRFIIQGSGSRLRVTPQTASPVSPNTDFDRTDLNVVPSIEHNQQGFTALSGVFTPGFGVWTVPVNINSVGVPTEANPNLVATFKQGMNNFACPTLQLYSSKKDTFYSMQMGGISYGFFQNNTFETDAELPFINQVTTIRCDSNGMYSQFLMAGQYPVTLSTGSNPGNPLLFGAGATFIPAAGLRTYSNGVLRLDNLGTKPVLAGYIVGGIQSTLPNTNTESDTSASPYVFSVTLVPYAPNP